MALVRGVEQYTGVSFFTAAGAEWPYASEMDAAGYDSLGRLPVTSATARNEVSYSPRANEFGSQGGQESAEKGMVIGRGEFTMPLQYTFKTFWNAIASIFASEIETASVDLVGTAVPASPGGEYRETLAWMPQSFQKHHGITGDSSPWKGSASGISRNGILRYALSGETNAYTFVEYKGCLFTGMTLSHTAGEVPMVTLRWISAPGQRRTRVAPTYIAEPARDRIKPRHLESVKVRSGGFMLDVNLSSYEINLNANLALDKTPLNDIDTLQRPGHTAPWEVSGELRHSLEPKVPQAETSVYIMATSPSAQGAATKRSLRITYRGETNPALSDEPRAFDITIPSMVFDSPRAPIDTNRALQAVIPFHAVVSEFDNVLPMSFNGGATNYKNTICLQLFKSALDWSGQAMAEPDGGTVPHTDLEV